MKYIQNLYITLTWVKELKCVFNYTSIHTFTEVQNANAIATSGNQIMFT